MIDTPLPGLPPAVQRALADKPGMAAAWQQRERAKANGGQRRESNPRPRPASGDRSDAHSLATPRIDQAATPHTYPAHAATDQSITLDDAALEDWASSLTTRIGLQSELVWVGLNDGYADAGGRDVAIPYLALYWLLGHTIKGSHCQSCLLLSFGNPYDPPGTPGGKVIYQSPGDGHTECGAGCKCWLEYGMPRVSLPKKYAWDGINMPGPGKATSEIAEERDRKEAQERAQRYSWRELTLIDPASEYLTDRQAEALDLFRAKWYAWEDARGDLPQLPRMFEAMDEAETIFDLDMFLTHMDENQLRIFYGAQDAIAEWNAATAEANAALGDTATEDND